MLDAEVTDEKVTLVNYEGKGDGPINADLPEMFGDGGFSLLSDGFANNPMDDDGGVRVEVIAEDVQPLIEFLEDNMLDSQPAFAKIKARS